MIRILIDAHRVPKSLTITNLSSDKELPWKAHTDKVCPTYEIISRRSMKLVAPKDVPDMGWVRGTWQGPPKNYARTQNGSVNTSSERINRQISNSEWSLICPTNTHKSYQSNKYKKPTVPIPIHSKQRPYLLHLIQVPGHQAYTSLSIGQYGYPLSKV